MDRRFISSNFSDQFEIIFKTEKGKKKKGGEPPKSLQITTVDCSNVNSRAGLIVLYWIFIYLDMYSARSTILLYSHISLQSVLKQTPLMWIYVRCSSLVRKQNACNWHRLFQMSLAIWLIKMEVPLNTPDIIDIWEHQWSFNWQITFILHQGTKHNFIFDLTQEQKLFQPGGVSLVATLMAGKGTSAAFHVSLLVIKTRRSRNNSLLLHGSLPQNRIKMEY